MSKNELKPRPMKIDMPTAEALQRELSSATSMDDFLGRMGYSPDCSARRYDVGAAERSSG